MMKKDEEMRLICKTSPCVSLGLSPSFPQFVATVPVTICFLLCCHFSRQKIKGNQYCFTSHQFTRATSSFQGVFLKVKRRAHPFAPTASQCHKPVKIKGARLASEVMGNTGCIGGQSQCAELWSCNKHVSCCLKTQLW